MAKRKSGPRTKSGRLSRAYRDPRLRDHGTEEAQAKRKALVGDGADLTLAATAPGILFARGYLERDQYTEALEYRRLRCALYGPPWPSNVVGGEPSDGRLKKLKADFERKVELLTEEQRRIITNVCVYDQIPVGYILMRENAKGQIPGDPLTDGLTALVHGTRRPKKRNLTTAPCFV